MLTGHHPCLVRQFDGLKWQVSKVHPYMATGETIGNFAIALLTTDGNVPERDDWDTDFKRMMYISISLERTVMSWPEIPENWPQVGQRMTDGEVAVVLEFEPLHPHKRDYQKVAVCWLIPAMAPVGIDPSWI